MLKSSTFSQRITALQRRITRFDYLCSGNLRRRYTVCGTENCLCKARPPFPHGPYYYWSRLLGGRVVQRILSPEQARMVEQGIGNYKEVKRVLRQWEEETVQNIESRKKPKR